jgi:purine-nucleoside phosphorylase
MGMPSVLIYATELIRQYGVTSLLRIGSCGGIHPDLSMRDIVIASGASTDSNANRLRFGGFDFAAIADFELTRMLVEVAEDRDVPFKVGNILSSDQFYHPQPEVFEVAQRMGVLAVEMEAAGLFAVAAEHGVRAAAILTVSDILGSDEEMPAEDRQTSLDEMITIALDSMLRIEE